LELDNTQINIKIMNMRILKKIFYIFSILFVSNQPKLKAQKFDYLLYSNKPLNHKLSDTCNAKLLKNKNGLVLYSRKEIDTFYFQPKMEAKLFKFYIGKLFSTGYYLNINGQTIYLKNGVEEMKDLENKYEIMHYSHASHLSHASHYSHYSSN
jgi:hypothetical protein